MSDGASAVKGHSLEERGWRPPHLLAEEEIEIQQQQKQVFDVRFLFACRLLAFIRGVASSSPYYLALHCRASLAISCRTCCIAQVPIKLGGEGNFTGTQHFS